MIPSVLLSFREGLEAALIIGALLGVLNKVEQSRYKKWVWAGAGGAALTSLAVGVGLYLWGASFEGKAEQLFEGITMLLSAAMLTWVILWMLRQAQSLSHEIKNDARQLAFNGSVRGLFALAFLAVVREGLELTLILTAASFSAGGGAIILGALLGLAAALACAWLLFKRLIRLDLRPFFRVTSILLILFAAGLVAHAVHELNEAGWVPEIVAHVWDLNPVLDETSFGGEILKTLFGYNGNPSLTEVIAYLAYSLALLAVFLRQPQQKRFAAAS